MCGTKWVTKVPHASLRASLKGHQQRRQSKDRDGHNLYLIVKNGKGFWVYQFRDGNVIRSKGLGSAARVTPAQARRAREAFAVARREGIEIPGGVRSHQPRGDKLAVAADAYLSNHANEWSERHRAGLKALVRMHTGAITDMPGEPDHDRASRRYVAADLERTRQQPGKSVTPAH